MSHFAAQAQVEPIGDFKWKLISPLVYFSGLRNVSIITVPSGFINDGASVPRIFWNLIMPTGLHFAAAILHDWLYFCGDHSKAVADGLFLEAMESLKVPRWRRWIMFYVVLFFGWKAWYNHRKAGHK